MPPRSVQFLIGTSALVALAGCNSYQHVHITRHPNAITAFAAAWDAHVRTPNTFITSVPVNTRSMEPVVNSPCYLLIERKPYSSLVAGEFILRTTPDTDFTKLPVIYVAHVTRWYTPEGWHTYGINNARMDPTPMDSKSYVGVVIGVFAYQDAPASH
jgi:hypothetical protein